MVGSVFKDSPFHVPVTRRTTTTTTTKSTTTETTTMTTRSICNEDLPPPMNGNSRCRLTKFGKLCYHSCPAGSAFPNGQSRKIYFCDEQKQLWRPEQVYQNCPKRLRTGQRRDEERCKAGYERAESGKCTLCAPGNFRSPRVKYEKCQERIINGKLWESRQFPKISDPEY